MLYVYLSPLTNTSYPWERIAADLFGSTYLLVIDYYSRFMKVQKLNTTMFSSVVSLVTHLKSIFTRFGIPTTMITDNGPQFDYQEMKEFYGFWQALTTLKPDWQRKY